MRTRNQHDPALLPQPRMRLPSQAHPDELWIAPAACGVHASHGHTCVVALHPGTQQVAAIRDFPRSFAAEWLNEHLTAIADLSCHPLCFATDWTSVPDEVRKSIPWGPWDWVQNPTENRTSDPAEKGTMGSGPGSLRDQFQASFQERVSVRPVG